jgi:hypothetical protein
MNSETTIPEILEKSTMEDSINLIAVKEEKEPFNSPFFSEKKDNLKSFINFDSPNQFQFTTLDEKLGTSPTIGTGNAIISGWKNIENISARLIEFYDNVVVLECLIDREQGLYEEREFRSSVFSQHDLHIGNLFYLRIFERENESRIEIHSDPELNFIEDFPKINFNKLFKESNLFKK